MPSAPLGVSSQSGKKLKAFAFDDKLRAGDDDKENQTTESAPSRIEQVHPSYNEQYGPPRPRAPHTPAVRIPIEDLIANTEDAYNCAPPLATPIDHVHWQNPASSDATGQAGATQRSRKRAHSSSPGSSQQLSAQKDALNMDALHTSLRTPNNDPTQELWNRYTNANGLKKDVKEPTLPVYAHLLPSSPQTPSTSSKDSGFRRTHSCGVEWPASKSKRRKLEEQHNRTKELFAASRKDILRRDLSNNTRVGLLLERIQESLTKKTDAPKSPSSSSPLPDRHSQALVSPTKAWNRATSGSRTPRDVSHSPRKSSPLKQGTSRDVSFSSEFSDDGIGIEDFEEAFAQTQAQNGAVAALPPLAEDVTEDESTYQPHVTVPPLANDVQGPDQLPSSKKQVSDEFDDDDDEDLMNEMMDLAAQYDSQSQGVIIDQPAFAAPTPEVRPECRQLETLDEFDDAFDDDDELWADIATATQKGRTPTGSKSHVCPA